VTQRHQLHDGIREAASKRASRQGGSQERFLVVCPPFGGRLPKSSLSKACIACWAHRPPATSGERVSSMPMDVSGHLHRQ